MSYGTVVIQDGVYRPVEPDRRFRNLPVREGALMPRENTYKIQHSNELKTFEMDLRYTQKKNIYLPGSAIETSDAIEYGKRFRRIASASNPTRDLKRLVAQFAGCDEAHKLRKRIIALSKIHLSVSNETFRFGLEGS